MRYKISLSLAQSIKYRCQKLSILICHRCCAEGLIYSKLNCTFQLENFTSFQTNWSVLNNMSVQKSSSLETIFNSPSSPKRRRSARLSEMSGSSLSSSSSEEEVQYDTDTSSEGPSVNSFSNLIVNLIEKHQSFHYYLLAEKKNYFHFTETSPKRSTPKTKCRCRNRLST